MSDVMTYGVLALGIFGGFAMILHALAAFERAKNPELAKKLEAYEHGIDALEEAGKKIAGGESFFQVALEEAESPHGQAVIQGLLDRVRGAPPASSGSSTTPPAASLLAAALAGSLLLGGCSTTLKEHDQVIRGGRALLSDPVCDQVQDPEWQRRRGLWLVQANPIADAATPTSASAPASATGGK